VAEPVRARRLSDQEGQRLTQIVRRGRGESIRVRRAMMIMASASGTPVPAIARLVAADEDTVRDVIHAFNEKGLACLDPKWAGGRPRLISDDDIAFIVETATTRPARLGRPFTHWSIRKLADYLATGTARSVRIGRERPGRSCTREGSPSSAPGPGRNPGTRTRKPSWIGSSTSPATSPSGASPSTSSDRFRSGPATDRRGRRGRVRTGCRRLTAALMASATSTAVTPWAMTSCGA
jgi:transposase